MQIEGKLHFFSIFTIYISRSWSSLGLEMLSGRGEPPSSPTSMPLTSFFFTDCFDRAHWAFSWQSYRAQRKTAGPVLLNILMACWNAFTYNRAKIADGWAGAITCYRLTVATENLIQSWSPSYIDIWPIKSIFQPLNEFIWKLFQRALKAGLVDVFCSYGLGSVMILIMMVKWLSF